MKYIILISIFLASCPNRTKPYVITDKMYDDIDGICNYSYNVQYTFQDSCNKYFIRDII